MPDEYETIITDEGINISKGQRQLITIARAFLSDTPMLILDEATSALDNRTQKQVSDALDGMGCTRIVIAHRLSTIQNADKIIVVNNGSIEETGTHTELMQKQGFYYRHYQGINCLINFIKIARILKNYDIIKS